MLQPREKLLQEKQRAHVPCRQGNSQKRAEIHYFRESSRLPEYRQGRSSSRIRAAVIPEKLLFFSILFGHKVERKVGLVRIHLRRIAGIQFADGPAVVYGAVFLLVPVAGTGPVNISVFQDVDIP